MSWKHVCSAEEVAEDSLKLFTIDGISILLARTGGEFRAYPPMCPHMEEPLAESGLCSAGVLTCNKHLWQWDMLTGEEQGPAEKPLLMYKVKQEGTDVLVHLEEELKYDFDEEEDDDFEW